MNFLRIVGVVSVASVASLLACGDGAPSEAEGFGELTESLSGTVTIKAAHSGKCLQVMGNAGADGAVVQQQPCSNGDNQRFTLRAAGSGRYQLATSRGKCLDIKDGRTDNGAIVQQWGCGGQANQRWSILKKDGKYALQAAHSGKCVDVQKQSTADGATLHQWTCGAGTYQRFSLAGLVDDAGTGGSGGASSSGGSSGSGSSGSGSSGSSSSGSSSGTGGTLAWSKANLTNFTSYPDPGSEECIEYNGCTWAGYFAGLNGKQTEAWVQANNIAAVHSKDFAQYRGKTLRLKQGTKTIDAVVYDMCSDSDCDGCCTRNAGSLKFLIDVEKYTMQRFGTGSGVVEWACVDCK